MMTNRLATRALAILAAVSMVIAMSMTTTVVVDAREAGYTVSIAEEIEDESIVAAIEVTEMGVVNYGTYAC